MDSTPPCVHISTITESNFRQSWDPINRKSIVRLRIPAIFGKTIPNQPYAAQIMIKKPSIQRYLIMVMHVHGKLVLKCNQSGDLVPIIQFNEQTTVPKAPETLGILECVLFIFENTLKFGMPIFYHGIQLGKILERKEHILNPHHATNLLKSQNIDLTEKGFVAGQAKAKKMLESLPEMTKNNLKSILKDV